MPSNTVAVASAQSSAGKGKRLHIMIDFATALEKRLSASSLASVIDDQLLDALRGHIDTLHLYCQKPNQSFSGNDDLDKLGTSIWNLSTRLMRDSEGEAASADRRRLAVHVRVFSFHLLDAAQHTGKVGLGNRVRLTRLALKAGKSSIEASELKLAGFALQKAADYVKRLAERNNSLVADDAEDVRGLEAEYYILRTALSWKEDRLDVAEHMYKQGHVSGRLISPRHVEKLADVLYEMGKDLTTKKDFPMAVKWLERAHDIINSHDIEQLSREALDLRTAIMQAYITALVNLGTNEAFTKADNLIEFLQSEVGRTMVVLVLRLELLTKAPAEVFDSDAYAAILSQMITCLGQRDMATDLASQPPGDADFRLIIHHVGKLYDKSPTLGCAVLDDCILELSEVQHDEWIERLVTKRIWMATNKSDSMESVVAAEAVVSRIRRPLSSDATVAVQTLIWKTMESLYNQKLFDIAALWCKLALHRIFENSGPLNRAKIERKHLLCALARNDVDGARSIYHSMAEQTQKEPRTQYLMYKIAVRSDDRDAATTCLDAISQLPEPLEYLYACCLDARGARHKDFAIQALSKLLEKNAHSSSSPIHLPALLRCIIRLMVKEYDEHADETERSNTAQKICEVFNEVVASIQRESKDAGGNKLFDINELDWFARNAYNLGLKHLEAWHVSHIIQILTACTSIMRQFPADVSSEIAADIALKTLFNNFIVSSALLARARASDNVEDELQDYLLMRKHVAAFDQALPAQLPALVDKARDDMLSKLAALLAFDFEAALRLRDYAALGEIVRKTGGDCRSATALQAMADCLLRSGGGGGGGDGSVVEPVPVQTTYATLRLIIDQLWALDGKEGSAPSSSLDVAKLSRYMRCLFQVALPLDDDLALGLAGEYRDVTREAAEKGAGPPPEETEWLATTAFNHAVDCYYARRDEPCKRWAFRAFELARLCADGGRLEAVMHAHFITLNFDVR